MSGPFYWAFLVLLVVLYAVLHGLAVLIVPRVRQGHAPLRGGGGCGGG